jgi:hypothetical protein
VSEEYLQQAVKYLPKNVWGFNTASSPGSLVPVDGMMNSLQYIKLLKSRVLPVLQTFADGKWTSQHDLVPCHNSKVVKVHSRKQYQHARLAW